MLVRHGDRTLLQARAKAEPGADVLTRDFYAQRQQIHLTADAPERMARPATKTEVTLDGNDVARLVECAIRHPTPNMRYGVLAAIWNHPDTFRELFRFGLDAPAGFQEIRKIVAEELGRRPPASDRVAAETLLPRMPLPAHLRDREKE